MSTLPLLLDTHVLLWALYKQDRLGPQTRQIIENPSQLLVVSYFTFLEVKLKSITGRLQYSDEMFDDAEILGVTILEPDRQLINLFDIFNVTNKDPFDNLIIASSIAKGYPLVTVDRRILATRAVGLEALDGRK